MGCLDLAPVACGASSLLGTVCDDHSSAGGRGGSLRSPPPAQHTRSRPRPKCKMLQPLTCESSAGAFQESLCSAGRAWGEAALDPCTAARPPARRRLAPPLLRRSASCRGPDLCYTSSTLCKEIREVESVGKLLSLCPDRARQWAGRGSGRPAWRCVPSRRSSPQSCLPPLLLKLHRNAISAHGLSGPGKARQRRGDQRPAGRAPAPRINLAPIWAQCVCRHFCSSLRHPSETLLQSRR